MVRHVDSHAAGRIPRGRRCGSIVEWSGAGDPTADAGGDSAVDDDGIAVVTAIDVTAGVLGGRTVLDDGAAVVTAADAAACG